MKTNSLLLLAAAACVLSPPLSSPGQVPSPSPPYLKVGATYIFNGNEDDLVRVLELTNSAWIKAQTKSGETWVNTANLTTVAEVSKDAASKSVMKEKADYILNDVLQIDQAIAAYARKNNLPMNAPYRWEDIRKFLKPNTPVYNSGGKDVTGRPFIFGATVGEGVKVNPETIKEFTPLFEEGSTFWGKYK